MKKIKQLIAWMLIITFLPLTALAAGKPQVSASYTGEAKVGECLYFTLTGVNSPALALQVVTPDSRQQLYEGAHISVLLEKPGLHVFIAYGANGADDSVPGFERCMSAPIRVQVAGAEAAPQVTAEPAATPEPTQQPAQGLELYATRGNNAYGYWDTVDVIWNTQTILEGSYGSLQIRDAAGNALASLGLTNQGLQKGYLDLTFDLGEKPGSYQVELTAFNTAAAPREDAAVQLTIEKDPAMAFVDRIAYYSETDYEDYWAFRRWMNTSKPFIHELLGYAPSDYTNSGYLMLNRLLDETYDYEDSQFWFPLYQGVMTGLKMDLGALFEMYAQGEAEGWGQQVFTDVLCDTGVYYIQNIMESAQTIQEDTEAQERFSNVFFESSQAAKTWLTDYLPDWLDKKIPISAAEAERLKGAFGKSGGAGRSALNELVKSRNLTAETLDSMGLELSPSGNVMLKFSNGSADQVYRTLKTKGMLGDEAGQRFEEAYFSVKKAQGKNAVMVKGGKLLDASGKALEVAGKVLSVWSLLDKAARTSKNYSQEKQQALQLVATLAYCSESYIAMLESMLRVKSIWTDQQRGGVERYISLLKASMNKTLEENLGDLDALATQIAENKTAGDRAGVAYAAAEFVYDLFKDASLLPDLAAKFGLPDASSKAGFVLFLIKLGATLTEAGIESTWHVSEKHEAARVMYAAELLIINSDILIDAKLAVYAKQPTPEAAREIIQLIQHHKALKLAGEEAAWDFVKIDLNDAIYRLYEERRDAYVSDMRKEHPIMMLPFVGKPEDTLTHTYLILVNSQQQTVHSYLDLAYLYKEHGAHNIKLQQPSDRSRIVSLYDRPSLLALLKDIAEIIDTTTADFQPPFEATNAWINSLEIPNVV